MELTQTHPAHAGGAFLLPCICCGCRAFLLPCYNTAENKRLQRLLYHSCSYTTHATKQRTGLYRCFSCDLSHSTTTDTRPIQAAIIPPAQRWSVSQRRSASSAYQIPAPRRTPCRSAQPPYYNNVYKGAAVRYCYGSMPDSAADRRPCQPGGVSSYRLRIAGKCYTRRTF